MQREMASESIYVRTLLQDLIESAQQNWTYCIFWRASDSEQGSLLSWGDGYYNGDQEDERNPSSSSLKNAKKEHQQIKVFPELKSLISGPQAFAPQTFTNDKTAVVVTDRLLFFLFSTSQLHPKGSGLPDQSWQHSVPFWITGREHLASCNFERPRRALKFGIRTLVFIPSKIGVIELGSTSLNFQSVDLVSKAMILLNHIRSSEMAQLFQHEDESESSNSIGNSFIVGSSTHFSPVEGEELSLELHLGLKASPVNPGSKSKKSSSSSSIGNYPVAVVKEKEKPQFSGKLQLGSDDHSDSTDVNAFLRILKHRQI